MYYKENVVNMQITRVGQACDWVGEAQPWSRACSSRGNIAVEKETGSDRHSSIEIDVYSSVKIKQSDNFYLKLRLSLYVLAET